MGRAEAPSGFVCAWGRAGVGGPKEQGLGTRSPAPPDPNFLGSRSPDLGYRNTCRGVSPSSGLDPVRKEINKKGGKGDWGAKGLGYSVQTKGPGDGGGVSPGQARAGIRVSLGLGPRCRGLRGLQ